MDRDNLLRRVQTSLLFEHDRYGLAIGREIPWGEDYHRGTCDVCDLLREIDESLESPGHVCDCHPKGGTEGKHLLIDIV